MGRRRPRWPGVYYAGSPGCSAGGIDDGVNCQVTTLPGDLLELGVVYQVDTSTVPDGIYYVPDFAD